MIFTVDKNDMKINVGVFLNSFCKHITIDIKFPIIAIEQKTMDNIAVTKLILFFDFKISRYSYYSYNNANIGSLCFS